MRQSVLVLLAMVLVIAGSGTFPVTSAETTDPVGINGLELVATADADGDGHLSTAELVVTANTTCPGCYDSDSLIEDPKLEPVIEIAVNGSTVLTVDADRRPEYQLRRYLTTLVDVVDRQRASVTVTLYDQDPFSRDRIDAQTMTVTVESPAADHHPNKTRAEPKSGLPTPNTTRSTAHFNFTYKGLEKCGLFCRDAVGTVTNIANETIRDVAVQVRLRAGTTIFWQGTEQVGTLTANESYTTTQRINGSYEAYRAVTRNDGRVALVIEVRSTRWREVIAFERDLL